MNKQKMQIYEYGCGCGTTLYSKKEKIRLLNEYREELQNEIKSVSGEIKELEAKTA
jgi:hypothetical protein